MKQKLENKKHYKIWTKRGMLVYENIELSKLGLELFVKKGVSFEELK